MVSHQLLKHCEKQNLKMKNFVTVLLVAFVLSVGCSKPPEKTQDPDEIEKLRQEHKSMAEREMSDG